MSLDITLFIGTCDKYHMLWEYFITQADKYFEPKCKKIFISENKKVSSKGYKTYLAGKQNWSDRMKDALEEVDTKYVFVLLDDYLLREKVTIESVTNYINFLESVDGNKIMIAPYDNKNSYQVESKRYGKKNYMKLTKNSSYQTAIMPSVVNVEWFKDILNPNQSIHEFEIDGTNDIMGKDNKIYFDEKQFPGIAPGIVRNGGFLIEGWSDFFKKENLGDSFNHIYVVEELNGKQRLLLNEE
tara:strand:+ start:443 stop:1168 length:726 start_codon:yes stop_codon:yes gene_type:complete